MSLNGDTITMTRETFDKITCRTFKDGMTQAALVVAAHPFNVSAMERYSKEICDYRDILAPIPARQ